MRNHQQANTGDEPWTILRLLRWTTSYFESHKIDTPRLDAEILLAHILRMERVELYSQHDLPLCGHELARFKSLITRRARREPVAYIVGSKGFWSLELAVTSDVLIPRPETEHLVESALSLVPEDPGSAPRRILDMGTGSGAIVLALASERPGHLFFASDRSPRALDVARKNVGENGLGDAVRFFSGDWFAPLRPDGKGFDLILSNPPYIRTEDIKGLQPDVRYHEPVAALDGGEDGLDCIRHIIRSASAYLAADGHLLLEIGHDQKSAVREMARNTGRYGKIVFEKDYAGHDRVVRLSV